MYLRFQHVNTPVSVGTLSYCNHPPPRNSTHRCKSILLQFDLLESAEHILNYYFCQELYFCFYFYYRRRHYNYFYKVCADHITYELYLKGSGTKYNYSNMNLTGLNTIMLDLTNLKSKITK